MPTAAAATAAIHSGILKVDRRQCLQCIDHILQRINSHCRVYVCKLSFLLGVIVGAFFCQRLQTETSASRTIREHHCGARPLVSTVETLLSLTCWLRGLLGERTISMKRSALIIHALRCLNSKSPIMNLREYYDITCRQISKKRKTLSAGGSKSPRVLSGAVWCSKWIASFSIRLVGEWVGKMTGVLRNETCCQGSRDVGRTRTVEWAGGA